MMDWLKEYCSPDDACGEVVSSDQTGFELQAYRYGYEHTPEYGSIVVANCGTFLTVGAIISSKMIPSPGLPAVLAPMRATREQVQGRYPDLEGRLIDTYKATSIGHYSDGVFKFGRSTRKPLIHDLVYIPSTDLIREFHWLPDGYSLDYYALLISSLDPGDLEPFSDVYFALLARDFEVEERVSLYETLSISLARWGNEQMIADLTSLAKRRMLEETI